jgi:hypothetical protein
MSDTAQQKPLMITEKYTSADDGDTLFGKRWASQLVRINAEQLTALQEGKYLALDVQEEYIVYLQVERKNGDD